MPSLPFGHVGLGDRLAAWRHRGETPGRVAAEQPHQVHDVRAQHPQVLAAAALVFFAAAAKLQDPAELAARRSSPCTTLIRGL